MRYKIEVLSPVHVGSGEVLTRFDYVWEDGWLYVLSLDRILEHPRVRAEELAALMERGDFDWCDYLRRQGIEPLAVARYRARSARDPTRVLGRGDVREHIKDPRFRPYIPGSSVKGAIRTALAWAMLSSGEYSISLRDIGYNPRYAARTLESVLFGSDPNHDMLRALMIFDSEPLPSAGQIAVMPSITYSLRERVLRANTRLHIWVEVLPVGTYVEGRWSVDKILISEEVAKILGLDQRRNWLKHIAKHCKRFAAKLIEGEIQFYAGQPSVMRFYHQLSQMLGAMEDDAFLMQMAWGTGWKAKTLGVALGSDLLQEIRRRFRLGRLNVTFPKTRRLAGDLQGSQVPFGWVSVRLVD